MSGKQIFTLKGTLVCVDDYIKVMTKQQQQQQQQQHLNDHHKQKTSSISSRRHKETQHIISAPIQKLDYPFHKLKSQSGTATVV